MKILHVIPYFTPRRGGDSVVVYSLSEQLAKKGHQCSIITTDYQLDSEYARDIAMRGVEIIPFHCIANIQLFLLSPGMRNWLKNNIAKFDLVHMHDLRSYQNILAYSYARKYDIPYILHPHGTTPRAMGKKGLKWLYDVAFGYRLIRGASHIIAVSNEEAEQDKAMVGRPDKISVIYNGMKINGTSNYTISKSDFKKKNNVNGKMILYLGRLHKSKGIDYALDAFFALCPELEDLTFVIVGGDDGYKVTLENIVKKSEMGCRVKFTGAISEADKLSAYANAALFVYPVRGGMGGVGLAPFEAILSDVPVIVSDACSETIRAAEAGYIVKFGDIDDLKTKMKRALQNPEESLEMIARGKKYILENLTWDRAAAKVEDIYEDCVRKTVPQ